MSSNEYQGYTNYATWVVNLWLTNTYSAYNQLMRIIESPEIKTSEKPNALRYYVISNVRGARNLNLDIRAERWAVGIRKDLSEASEIEETMQKLNGVNWDEIIESNKN